MKDSEMGRLASREEIDEALAKITDPDLKRMREAAKVKDFGKRRRKVTKDAKGNPYEFLRGPVAWSWLRKASAISYGAAFLGLTLWHLERLKGAPVTLTRKVCQRYGFARRTEYRLLRALAANGLITMELDERRSARVSVIKEPQQPQPLETVQ